MCHIYCICVIKRYHILNFWHALFHGFWEKVPTFFYPIWKFINAKFVFPISMYSITAVLFTIGRDTVHVFGCSQNQVLSTSTTHHPLFWHQFSFTIEVNVVFLRWRDENRPSDLVLCPVLWVFGGNWAQFFNRRENGRFRICVLPSNWEPGKLWFYTGGKWRKLASLSRPIPRRRGMCRLWENNHKSQFTPFFSPV